MKNKGVPNARPPLAVVSDWDGVLGQEDIGAAFWETRKLETEYWTLAKRVQENRGRPSSQVDADLQSHFSAAHGLSLKIMMEKHLAQLHATGHRLHISELEAAADGMTLSPGAKALVDFLKQHPQIRNRVYVNSSAYEPILRKLAGRLGIPAENVFGTPVLSDAAGFVTGIGKVNGGINKMDALAKIVRHSRVPRRNWIVLGDSKGDLPLLPHVAGKRGLAIWFNPTDAITADLHVRPSDRTVVVSSSNLKSVISLVRAAAQSGPSNRAQTLSDAIRGYNRYARRVFGIKPETHRPRMYRVANQELTPAQRRHIRQSREKLRKTAAMHSRMQ
ncbi:haloacid dehalogenase-like hydrolase [Candidatus Micrarchaeota archaeon]|nr:haloacid dehalogenase-like hydrolase [Candidatus Micrarchaeota archaeon]